MDVSMGSFPMAAESPGIRGAALLSALRRRAWLVVLCALLGAAGAVAFSTTLPKRYTVSGKITIAGESLAIPELQGALRANNGPDQMLVVRTEVQALSSRRLLQRVCAELHLADLAEFNPALRPPQAARVLAGRLWRRLGVSAPEPSAPLSASEVEDAVIDTARRDLAVFNDNHSLVIDVTFVSGDPQRSADFVNTLIRDYIATQASQRSSADQDANEALLRRIDTLNREISGLEGQVTELRDKSQIVGLRAGSIGQQQLEELALQVTHASLARSELQSTLSRATALARSGNSDELAAVLSSQTVSRLREQEATAARQVAELSTRYGSGFPGLHDAQASLDSAHRLLSGEVARIIASLSTQLDVAREHEADAQRQLAAARDEAVRTGTVQARLDELKQQIADRRTLSQTLVARTQQTALRPAAEQTPDVRVLSPAFPVRTPSSPRTGLAGAFGLVAGAMLGALACVATARDPGAASPGGVARTAGLPVLCVLPSSACGPRPARGRAGAADEEALRTLRSRIRVSSRAGAPRVVAFVPARQDRATSGLAAAFARQAATDGERVLLVEANLRAPTLRAPTLRVPAAGRLAEVLAGTLGWRDAVVREGARGPDLLAAGGPVQDAHALLSGMRLQNLLVEAREDYTLVVLSAPSAALASDALVVAHRADATVLVLGATRRGGAADRAFADELAATATGPVAAVLVAG